MRNQKGWPKPSGCSRIWTQLQTRADIYKARHIQRNDKRVRDQTHFHKHSKSRSQVPPSPWTLSHIVPYSSAKRISELFKHRVTSPSPYSNLQWKTYCAHLCLITTDITESFNVNCRIFKIKRKNFYFLHTQFLHLIACACFPPIIKYLSRQPL